MKLYCLCKETAELGRGKRNAFFNAGGPAAVVIAGTQMSVEYVGISQVLETPEGTRPHYPTVDVRRCPACGHRVVIE